MGAPFHLPTTRFVIFPIGDCACRSLHILVVLLEQIILEWNGEVRIIEIILIVHRQGYMY